MLSCGRCIQNTGQGENDHSQGSDCIREFLFIQVLRETDRLMAETVFKVIKNYQAKF